MQASVPPPPSVAGRPLEDWLRALDTGRAAEIRPILERDSTSHPSSALAAALLARTYLALGQKTQAAQAARRAETAIAASPAAQHTLALYYAATGNRKRAAELEALYARSPIADPEAAVRAALLFHQAGLFPQALATGEALLATSTRPELAWMVAKTRQAARQWEPCFSAYRRLLTLLPYDVDAHAAAAEAYLQAERFEDAITLLEQAQSLFPRSPQIQLSLGVAYYGQRRFLDAARQFLRANDLDPEAEQPYVFLGRMLDQLTPLADDILARVTRWAGTETTNPQAPLVYAKTLAAFAPARMAAEGVPLLRQAVARGPQLWEAHFELGCALEATQNHAEAATELEAAAQLSTKEAPIFYRLSRLYAKLNQPQKAAAARARHAALTAASSSTSGGMR